MILVTGGTGLVGAHLLLSLCQTEEKIRAVYRHQKSIQKTKSLFESYNKSNLFTRIEWFQADITDVFSLNDAFEGIELVFHCAAYISFDKSEEKKIRKINIEGTANMINLALHHEVNRFCHVSSIAALGHPKTKNEVITETTEWNPELAIDDYAISKYGAEMEVLRGEFEGLSTIIVNPGVIIGPGFWEQGSGVLFTKIKNGFRFYTDGSTAYTDINDLIAVMLRATSSSLSGKRIIVINGTHSYKTIFTSIATHLNLSKKLKQVSKSWVKMYYYWCTILSFLGAKRFIFSKSMFKSATTHKTYSNAYCKEVFGFEFKSIEQSIKETAQLYK
ncbi:MAG: NAD-dependent epimerase/dehydratase family protein [Flavobacteriales bacterium]|nr:NAD-dependent epimerase/dehydratase family protein [Flavobacteriales bacterium]